MKSIQLVLRHRCRTFVGHAFIVDDGADERLVDDKHSCIFLVAAQVDSAIARIRFNRTFHQSISLSVCCQCEALVEDDAEQLHRLLKKLDRDVIDLQDDFICRDVFASREEDIDCLVDQDLEAPFFEEFYRLRWVPLDASGQD